MDIANGDAAAVAVGVVFVAFADGGVGFGVAN